MSGPFDFRDLTGGANAKVEHDEALADGLKFEEQMASCDPRVASISNSLAEQCLGSLEPYSIMFGLSLPGIVELMVAHTAWRMTDAINERGMERASLDEWIASLRYRIAQIERGEFQ